MAFVFFWDSGEEDEDANDAVPEQIPTSRKVVKAASSP